MAFLNHFLILFWKNLILQKRKICVSVFEILLPLLFVISLILIRNQNELEWPASDNGSITFKEENSDDYPYGHDTVEILYTPNNTAVSSMIKTLDYNFTFTNATGFIDEKSMMQFEAEFWHLHPDYYMIKKFGGLVMQGAFNGSGDGFPPKMQIDIRPSSTHSYYRSWSTAYNFDFYPSTQLNSYRASYSTADSGSHEVSFLDVQYSIGRAIIAYISGSTTKLDKVKIQLKTMPTQSYPQDDSVSTLRFMVPPLLILSFILNCMQVTKSIVHEKQAKLKEMMKMMGVTDLEHWCAWFAKYFLYQLICISAIAIMLVIEYPIKQYGSYVDLKESRYGRVFSQSNIFIIFLFLMCYSISSITFCFFLSTLFKRANIAAGVAFILHILTYVPYNFVTIFYSKMTYSQKMSSCLLSNTAMGLGINVILMHEERGDGLQWSNIAEPAVYDDDFSMADVFIMLIVDICIHLFLTWYIDAVYPGEFGTPQPWYFPVKGSYWCGTKPQKSTRSLTSAEDSRDEFFEAEPRDLALGISIKNMKKVFRKGGRKHVAVAGVNLNMYEGQITALLGHNGAGKTTTIHMLTGFLTTTDGTAVINGYDIHEDMMNVRKNLGLCHQHSVLFESLTVEEHLIFCAKLKGTPSSSMKAEIQSTLETIRMLHKKDTFAGKLSGGEKRKLSVAMALVGDTKVVILDEPTSGMDPEARRNLWSILNQAKVGRTILLTTHYMEEADILGDRIAIMAEGVVKCCGSSLF